MKRRSEKLNEIGYTKLRWMVNKRTDWVLRWVSIFLKGIGTLRIRWKGVERAQVFLLKVVAIRELGAS